MIEHRPSSSNDYDSFNYKFSESEWNTFEKHGGVKNTRKLFIGSGSEKYIITTADNERFLLKTFPLNMGRNVQNNKTVNNRISATNINIPVILEAGMTEADLLSYELMEWIPGISLENMLEGMPNDLQYMKGVAAGQTLKTIHALDYRELCVPNHTPLRERIKIVVERYDMIKRNGYPTYRGDIFRDYVLNIPYEQYEERLCMLHGDYHVGNIIEGENNTLWLIDWIYNLIGDPFEDFVRIFVSADKSLRFAKGQIDGYFDGSPTLSFWHKLKMFAAIQQLEILSYPLGKLSNGKTVQEHQHQIVYEQYDGMRTVIPQFYKNETGGRKR